MVLKIFKNLKRNADIAFEKSIVPIIFITNSQNNDSNNMLFWPIAKKNNEVTFTGKLFEASSWIDYTLIIKEDDIQANKITSIVITSDFIINVTGSTVNKTYAQVIQAIALGNIPILIDQGVETNTIYTFAFQDERGSLFTSILSTTLYTIRLKKDSTIERNSFQLFSLTNLGTEGQVLTVNANGGVEWRNPSGAVTSVNNQTGNVTITAQSLGALTQHQDISGKADKTEIIPKPAVAGTEGQVLTIDANGNPKWDNTSFVKVTDDGQGNVSMETLYGVLVDAAPAQNSNNLVTSGGIYNAISAVSGSSDIFFITATWDNSENTFVVNKTFAEINTAISNGKIPVLIAEGQSWYWLYDKAPTYLRFICIGGNNTNNYIHIQSNNNVTFSTISSANPTNYYTKTEIDNMIGNIGSLLASI